MSEPSEPPRIEEMSDRELVELRYALLDIIRAGRDQLDAVEIEIIARWTKGAFRP